MKKRSLFLLAVLAALCLMTACNKEEGPLLVYTLGENDTVASLDTILADGEAVMTSVDAPTDAAISEGLAVSHTYHYRKMADPAELAERYVRLLRGSDQGFSLIDEENHKLTEDPPMDILAGSVTLGKAAAENEEAGSRIFRVVVGWSEYAVAIQTAYVPGTVLPPVVVEEPEEETKEPSSMSEQLEFFNTLNPEKLGLAGDDMTAYMVFPQQALVLVDGSPCREMNVYLQDARDATNVFMGTFYISSDMTLLYKKNSEGMIVPVVLE